MLSNTVLGIPALVLAPVCLLVAAAFVWIRPKQHSSKLTGLRLVLLQWAHQVVWLLLAIACALYGIGSPGVAKTVAAVAGALYLLFLGVVATSGAGGAPGRRG